MEANRVTAAIFGLVYRLLALAALAWGIYGLMWQPYSIVSLMVERELSYAFPQALMTCLPSIVLNGTYLICGFFALYLAPQALKALYRE